MSSTGNVPKSGSADAQGLASVHLKRSGRTDGRKQSGAEFCEHMIALIELPEAGASAVASNHESECVTSTSQSPRRDFGKKPISTGPVPLLARPLGDAILRLAGKPEENPEMSAVEIGSIALAERDASHADALAMAAPRTHSGSSNHELARPIRRRHDAQIPPLNELSVAHQPRPADISDARSAHPGQSQLVTKPGSSGERPQTGAISIGSYRPDSDRSIPVRITRQEVHVPLVQRLPAAEQIAHVLIASSDGAIERQTASTRAVPQLPKPGDTIIRVLQIRLEPPELGTVTIRMRLESGALELRVEAQRAATAELIRRDQGTLSRLLQAAGYDVDGLTIHIAEPDRAALANIIHAQPTGSQSTPNLSPHGQLAGSQGDGRPGGESRNPQNGRAGEWTGTAEESPELPHAHSSRPNGVYV